jgi:hypothetical protein
VESIIALVDRYGLAGEHEEFRLIADPEPKHDVPIHSSLRVGLSLKAKKHSEDVLSYWAAPLRFFTRQIPKNKQLHVWQLLAEGGKSDEEIARVTGASKSSLASWKEAFTTGHASKDAAKHFGTKFSSGGVGECLGAYCALRKKN